MKRIQRDRPLTADEVTKYDQIREQVEEEFPPMTTASHCEADDDDNICLIYDSEDLLGSQAKARTAGAACFMLTRGECANVVYWVNTQPDCAPYRAGIILRWASTVSGLICQCRPAL